MDRITIVGAVVVSLRANFKIDASLEYPGWICIPAIPDGSSWAIGVANETWGGDRTPDDGSGEVLETFETAINSDDPRHPDAIANELVLQIPGRVRLLG